MSKVELKLKDGLILRKLKIKDAEFMQEYVLDKDFKNVFSRFQKTVDISAMVKFIKTSWHDNSNLHFAVEYNNEYAGTISLKNISRINQNAEYAIVIRKKFWGTHIALEATKGILKYGFYKLNLNKIYLNVIKDNIRANKFYEKFGFRYEGTFRNHINIYGKYHDLDCYAVFKEDMEEKL